MRIASKTTCDCLEVFHSESCMIHVLQVRQPIIAMKTPWFFQYELHTSTNGGCSVAICQKITGRISCWQRYIKFTVFKHLQRQVLWSPNAATTFPMLPKGPVLMILLGGWKKQKCKRCLFSRWWFQIFFSNHLFGDNDPALTNIFQRVWNHHLGFF